MSEKMKWISSYHAVNSYHTAEPASQHTLSLMSTLILRICARQIGVQKFPVGKFKFKFSKLTVGKGHYTEQKNSQECPRQQKQ